MAASSTSIWTHVASKCANIGMMSIGSICQQQLGGTWPGVHCVLPAASGSPKRSKTTNSPLTRPLCRHRAIAPTSAQITPWPMASSPFCSILGQLNPVDLLHCWYRVKKRRPSRSRCGCRRMGRRWAPPQQTMPPSCIWRAPPPPSPWTPRALQTSLVSMMTTLQVSLIVHCSLFLQITRHSGQHS